MPVSADIAFTRRREYSRVLMLSFVFSVFDLVGPLLGIYFINGFNIREFIIDARPDTTSSEVYLDFGFGADRFGQKEANSSIFKYFLRLKRRRFGGARTGILPSR